MIGQDATLRAHAKDLSDIKSEFKKMANQLTELTGQVTSLDAQNDLLIETVSRHSEFIEDTSATLVAQTGVNEQTGNYC